MADLQRRRGSSLLPRLRLPSYRGSTSAEEIDFSFATRSILEYLVRLHACSDEMKLDPVIDSLQGFEEGEEPQFICHVGRVVKVKASEMEDSLGALAETIITSHDTSEKYHQALNHFLKTSYAASSVAMPPEAVITRQQVLLLFALCSRVAYRCLQMGRCEEFRHFLPWSTAFIADSSQVESWVKSRGGWLRAFETKTPCCGLGTVSLIASFLVCTTLLIIVTNRK